MKAVILAGGSGTRLWPYSRKTKPKQFQKLISGHTMLQDTFNRLDFLNNKDIYVSTNEEHVSLVKEQLKGKLIPSNLIIEPALRDTAPCIGLAATVIGKKYPHEVMAIIYADHLIQNKKEFVEKLKIAEKLAIEEKSLNIIEVKAKYANVNLGYVKIGKMLKTIGGSEIYAFEKFTEKPDLAKALKLLESYKYLWNTGLYVWRTDIILEKYKKHLPKTYDSLKKIGDALGTAKEKSTIQSLYPLCEKISIDYGIMEKVDTSEVRIIPAELEWSDVGTWESIFEEISKNPKNNVVKGEYINIDSEGCLIYGTPKKLIATIGIKDVVIVETDDSLLVCKKSKSQDVKKLVESIKKKKKLKHLL